MRPADPDAAPSPSKAAEGIQKGGPTSKDRGLRAHESLRATGASTTNPGINL